MSDQERKALYDIMRAASYLPRSSEVRNVVEDAVSVALREADSEPPAESACEVCDGTGLWLACDDEWCDDLSHFAPCPRGCREGR